MTPKTSIAFSVLIATLLSFSSIAYADFDFGKPIDWFEGDDRYYRYGTPSRRDERYDRDRWRRYDKWEPGYWRHRFFDRDYNDYIYGRSDLNGNAKSRGHFGFDLNIYIDGDFDSTLSKHHFRPGLDRRYKRGRRFAPYRHDMLGNRSRNRSNPYRRDLYHFDSRPFDFPNRYRKGYTQYNDRYDDNYWRDYSHRHDRLGESPF